MGRRILLLACLSLALPGAAAAQQTFAPPGNAGVDEYLETVPGAGGQGRPSQDPKPLPADARRKLKQQGEEGQDALALAERSDPGASAPQQAAEPDPAPKPDGGEPARQPSADPLPEPSTPSFGSALAKALTDSGDSGGMGIWFPILLGVAAGLAGGVALARRRGGSGPAAG